MSCNSIKFKVGQYARYSPCLPLKPIQSKSIHVYLNRVKTYHLSMKYLQRNCYLILKIIMLYV